MGWWHAVFWLLTVTLVSILFLIRKWCRHLPDLSGTSVFKCACIYGSLLTMQEMRKYFPVTETALSSIKKEFYLLKGRTHVLIYPHVPWKERAPPMKQPGLFLKKIGGLKQLSRNEFFLKGSECVMEPQNDISGWNYDLKLRLFTQLVLQNFPPTGNWLNSWEQP